MKKYLLLITVAVATAITDSYAQTGMIVKEGITVETADPSAVLDVISTTKGFLVPRMTAAQRVAIGGGTPATGLLVFQTDGGATGIGFWYYDGSSWRTISSSGLTAGNDIDVTGSTIDIESTLNFVQTIDAALTPLTLNSGNAAGIQFQNAGTEKGRFNSTGLQLGIPGTSAGSLTFGNIANTNTVTIMPNNAATTTGYTIKLPAAQGANNQTLLNDGSGNLSWGPASSLGGALTNHRFWMGDAANTAQEVVMNGDATVAFVAGAPNNATVTISNGAVDGSDISLTGEAIGEIMQYSGTEWVSVDPSASNAWGILGNTNTTSGTNFIGTAAGNNQALDFRTNGVLHARMTTKGQIYEIGTGYSTWLGEFAGDADVVANQTANTFIGHSAGKANTTGAENVYVGRNTGLDMLTGSQNVAIGAGAMDGAAGTDADNNSALGYSALTRISDGDNNVAVGWYTLENVTTGGTNVAIGNQAGATVSTGSGNVFIGHNAGQNAVAATANKLYIDNSNTVTPLIYGDFGTDALEVNNTLTTRSWMQTGRDGQDGSLRIYAEQATDRLYTINPHAAAVQDITLTLPDNYPSANGQVLSSTTGGALSWVSTFTNPMNTTGDIIFSTDGSGTPDDLDPGANGTSLQISGGIPSWSKVDLTSDAEVTGTSLGQIYLGTSTGDLNALATANKNTLRYDGTGTTWVSATNLLNDGTDIGINADPAAATSVTKLDVGGNINASTGYYYTTGGVLNTDKSPMNIEVTRTLPTTVGDGSAASHIVNIGTFFNAQGAHNLRISVTVGEFSFSVAKTYIITANENITGTSWKEVLPVSSSGMFSGANDFTLDVRTTGTSGYLEVRLRRTNGTTAGTAHVRIESVGKTTEEFTPSSGTTYTAAVSAGYFGPSVNGNYILNQTSQQTSANFNIDGSGKFGNGAVGTPSIAFSGDIDNGLFHTGTANVWGVSAAGAEQMRFTTDGVGIKGGVATSTNALVVVGKVKSTGINETSDARLKMNFASIDGALNKVLAMNGKYYDWRVTEFPNKGLEEGRQIGVIAQEIEKILPEVVVTDDDGYKSVEYGHIVPVLIEAIKEQQQIIDGQKSTITDLKTSLENVLNRVNILEKNSDINSSKVEK